MQEEEPKYKNIIEGVDQLSLGISMVVAIIIGIGLGIWLKSLFDSVWGLWFGVFIGVSAAILNVYKAYKKQVKELDELAKDPKYKYSNQDKI